MSANPHIDHPSSEPTGEQIFFVMAGAFLALVAVIIVGAFLPLVAGIAVTFAALAVVLVLVGLFLGRVLRDG